MNKNYSKKWIFIVMLLFCLTGFSQQFIKTDICVYGGTSAGVIAAYTAAKLGKKVLLIEPGKHLGGLSAGGLGYTDIGNKYAVTGLSLGFYRNVGKHYGKFESWVFEPHVAENIFLEYIRSAAIPVLYENQLHSLTKKGKKITQIELEKPTGKVSFNVMAKMFIDCSYEGDLMAKAGVSYTVGREANSRYNETYNGVQLRDKHQFPDDVDPYKISGNPASGLLWGISHDQLLPRGTGDKKIQTYNYRLCLTDKVDNVIPVSRPDNYDSSKYELLLRILQKKPVKELEKILNFNSVPNGKTDINNNGAFSTDMIGANYHYAEATNQQRKEFALQLEEYTKGLLYFIGHDKRMPENLSKEMLRWGYPKDEYADNNHWSHQMYIREARRMTGEYVMTQANCEGKETVKDGIGMAAYTMDSHNCQRIVVNGMVKNEGDVQVGGFGPYPVSYRSIVPKSTECENLLVPVCLSASHIAYGSIRMEPVFMVLAQAAATAAVEAIRTKIVVQKVDAAKIREMIKNDPLVDGSAAEIVVDNDDTKNMQLKGKWQRTEHVGYGTSSLIDSAKDEEKWVKFTPEIKKRGDYNVYAYFSPNVKNASSQTLVTFSNGISKKEILVKKSDLEIEGQTPGGWFLIGRFFLQAGNKNYLTFSNKNADGTTVADAVLFKPNFYKTTKPDLKK